MRKLEEDLVAEMMEQGCLPPSLQFERSLHLTVAVNNTEQEMVRQYLAQQEQEDSALVQAAQSEEVASRSVCFDAPGSNRSCACR